MIKNFVIILFLFAINGNALAITPTFNTIREINFGHILPEPGSCRMISTTGVIINYIGQNICLLHETARNGYYTIVANPNTTIRVKVLANQDTGDGIVFNPYITMVSQGEVDEVIYNNINFQEINSGADGIVDLYLGGDFTVSTTYGYGQVITFSFIDAIEWEEVP